MQQIPPPIRWPLVGCTIFLLGLLVNDVELAENNTNEIRPIHLTSKFIRPAELRRLAQQDFVKSTNKKQQPQQNATRDEASSGGGGRPQRATTDSKKDISMLSISDNKKFQARIMRSTDSQQQQQQQQAVAAAAQRQQMNSSPYSSLAADNWQASHQIEPTFIDQEQGDDMVALASEMEPQQQQQQQQQPPPPPEHQVKILPPINRTFSLSSDLKKLHHHHNQQQQQQQQQQKADDVSASNSANQSALESPRDQKQPARQQHQHISPIDEYYTDEEDQEDELAPPPPSPPQPSRSTSKSPLEFGEQQQQPQPLQMSDQKRKQQEISDYNQAGNQYNAMLRGKGSYGGEQMQPINRTASMANNKMAAADVGSAWMPSAVSADKLPTNYNNQQQQQQQQQQQKPPENEQPNRASSLRRPAVGSDKLANLFGGRSETLGGALSKTDLAIEYLKNILKSKQNNLANNSGNNSSSPGEPTSANKGGEQSKAGDSIDNDNDDDDDNDSDDERLQRPPAGSLSRLYPLPIIANNNTNSNFLSTTTASNNSEGLQPAMKSPPAAPLQQYPAPDLTLGGTSRQVAAAHLAGGETRFSISDAKTIKVGQQVFDQQREPQSSSSPQPMAFTQPARPVDQDRYLGHSPVAPSGEPSSIYSKGQLEQQMMRDNQPQFLQESAASSLAPNMGQPAGDYLDRLEDYPRDLRQLPQNGPPQSEAFKNNKPQQQQQQPGDARPEPTIKYQQPQQQPQEFNQQQQVQKFQHLIGANEHHHPYQPSAASNRPVQADELAQAASEHSKKQMPGQFVQYQKSSPGGVQPQSVPFSSRFFQMHQLQQQQQAQSPEYTLESEQLPVISPEQQQQARGHQLAPQQLAPPRPSPARPDDYESEAQRLRPAPSNQTQIIPANKTSEAPVKGLPQPLQQPSPADQQFPRGSAEQLIQSLVAKKQYDGQHEQQVAGEQTLGLISEKKYENKVHLPPPPPQHQQQQPPQQQQHEPLAGAVNQPPQLSRPMIANPNARPMSADQQHERQNHPPPPPRIEHQQQLPPPLDSAIHQHHHHQHLHRQQQQPYHQQQYQQQQQHQQQHHQQQYQQQQQQKAPPKIVSYNYFETPNESPSGESELVATNYQLGDALLSSTGGIEQILSGPELEAIQSQFMTAEHPIVPITNNANQLGAEGQPQPPRQLPHSHHATGNEFHNQASALNGMLLNNLKNPANFSPEMLQRLQSPGKQAEEILKELASNEEQVGVMAPLPEVHEQQQQQHHHHQPASRPNQEGGPPLTQENQLKPPTEYELASAGDLVAEAKNTNISNSQAAISPLNDQSNGPPMSFDYPDSKDKKRSLIVYLNHPRTTEMSKSPTSSPDSIAPAVNVDQSGADPFVIAKEYDGHGLSKDGKHLDISSLRGLGDAKEAQDKDGLSVVVIGDAYKYKKIVLLISSKSGGLKFIPMVKDMKK